jgi:hypothetical protein
LAKKGEEKFSKFKSFLQKTIGFYKYICYNKMEYGQKGLLEGGL